MSSKPPFFIIGIYNLTITGGLTVNTIVKPDSHDSNPSVRLESPDTSLVSKSGEGIFDQYDVFVSLFC